MTWAVHHVAGSLAGTQGAGQVAKRAVERKEPARETRRFRDEFDQFTEASEAEAVEAARSLKDNTQEEAHEDRQQRGEQFPLPSPVKGEAVVYSPGRVVTPAMPGPRIDLEG
jgi:hypothetical protein